MTLSCHSLSIVDFECPFFFFNRSRASFSLLGYGLRVALRAENSFLDRDLLVQRTLSSRRRGGPTIPRPARGVAPLFPGFWLHAIFESDDALDDGGQLISGFARPAD